MQLRLSVGLAAVLAVTMTLGGLLVAWHAAGSVRTEIYAALSVGRSAVANGIEEAGAAGLSGREARHLIGTFDGNRHVRAELTDAQGLALSVSLPLPAERGAPGWFARAVAPVLAPVTVPVPNVGIITLTADPANELAEVWDQASDAGRTLAVFFGLTVLLIHWVVGRALHPLTRLAAAFTRIGAGDYAARLTSGGPPELASIAAGFNHMAGRLGEMAVQNEHLQEQLLTLQEEERAELARNLHDEVGPLLFATGIDAASLPALITTGRAEAALGRVEAIRESVAQIQVHLRAILGRLRPLAFGSVTLDEAVENLVAFWRRRHPDIVFTLDFNADDETLPDPLRATICHVVQESLCNALRHGRPGHIGISIARVGGDMLVSVTDDGVGAPAGKLSPGQGLTGMSERVRAQAGTLAITARPGGPGLAVTARLPAEATL